MPAAPADRSIDAIVVGGRSALGRRWSATSPAARRLLTAAAILAAVALALAELAIHAHLRHRTRTVVAPPARATATTDAAGCPVGVSCTISSAAVPAVAAAVRAAFPGAAVLSTVSTLDAATGRVYRRMVVAESATATVTVSAQCVPGAGSVRRQVLRGAQTFDELDGSSFVLSQTVQVVTPGRQGCSASVGADTGKAGRAATTGALRLSADPVVQLP